MCLALATARDGLSKRACGQCRECRARRINDLVGRCLAEDRHPAKPQSFAIDLTYANEPDGNAPVGAVVPLFSDVDLFLARLRASGRKSGMTSREFAEHQRGRVRFLCCSEFGSLKGRVHHHLIVWIHGEPIELPPERSRADFQYWPHGFVWIKPVDRKTIAYAAKYALKAEAASSAYGYGAAKKANYSRYPPLGDAYFAELARLYVEARLPVRDSIYTFPECVKSNGQRIRYYMAGKTRERFLARYVEGWRAAYGGEPPMSEFLVEQHYDRIARAERSVDPVDFARVFDAKRVRDVLVLDRGVTMPVPLDVAVDRRELGVLLFNSPAPSAAVAYSDGTIALAVGDASPILFPMRAAGGVFGSHSGLLGLTPAAVSTLQGWWQARASECDPPGLRYRGAVVVGEGE